MTPETLASLINLGAAGAVIIVVWRFLDFIQKLNTERQAQDDRRQIQDEKRDAEWRSFFVDLNSTNKDDVSKLSAIMERMITTLDAHDDQAKGISAIVKRIEDNTRPLPGRPGWERRGANK